MVYFFFNDLAKGGWCPPSRPGARMAWLGGAEINLGGHEKFIYVNARGQGARKVYSSVDQTKKVKTKKKVFNTKISTNSGCRLKILAIFHELLSEEQKKKKKVFVPKLLWNSVWVHKNYAETVLMLANSRAVNTILGVLGLDLHSSSPLACLFLRGPVLAWGAQFSFGGHGPGMPPVAPGLPLSPLLWLRGWPAT